MIEVIEQISADFTEQGYLEGDCARPGWLHVNRGRTNVRVRFPKLCIFDGEYVELWCGDAG